MLPEYRNIHSNLIYDFLWYLIFNKIRRSKFHIHAILKADHSTIRLTLLSISNDNSLFAIGRSTTLLSTHRLSLTFNVIKIASRRLNVAIFKPFNHVITIRTSSLHTAQWILKSVLASMHIDFKAHSLTIQFYGQSSMNNFSGRWRPRATKSSFGSFFIWLFPAGYTRVLSHQPV